MPIPQSNLIAQSDLPAAPTGLTATASANSVTLNWTDSDNSSAIHYQVLRSTDNFATPGTVVGETFIGGTTFTDTGLSPSTHYYYRVVGTNFDGTGTPASADVTTPVAPAGGSLTGTLTSSSGAVDLTALGTRDWVHFGLTNAATFDSKGTSPETTRLSNVSYVGDASGLAVTQITNAPSIAIWSDGQPDGSSTGTATGIAIPSNAGSGFEITAPADGTTARTLKVFVDETNAVGQLRARLSDGSAVDFVDSTLANFGTTTGAIYTITYKSAAGSTNQKLIVDWTLKSDTAIGTAAGEGTISIESATLGLSTDFIAPSNLAATSFVPGVIHLTFSNNTGGAETGIGIEESTDGGTTFNQVAVAPAGSSSIDIKNLDTTTNYQFRVRALGTTNSAYSNVAASTAAGTAPINLTQFSGTDVSLNGNALISGDNKLQLTDDNPNEASSAFSNNRQGVQAFDTTFDFQFTDPNADGFTFTLQNDPNGTSALGLGGGSLGYENITNSVAVYFNIYPNVTQTGIKIGEGAPKVNPIDMTPAGIDFHANSADIFEAHLTYNGSTLTETVTDLTTKAVFTQNYTVDIPGAVGDIGAYVGFTGGDGGAASTQDIINWKYTSSLPVTSALPSWATLGTGGAATYDSPTHTLTVTAGSVTVTDPNVAGPDQTDSAAIVVQGAGSHVDFTTTEHVKTLTLTGGATATMKSVSVGSVTRSAGTEHVLVIASGGSVNIDNTSKLDLTDNDMIVKGGTLSTLISQIISGRGTTPGGAADGLWNGTHGIGSSAAQTRDAADGFETTALGIAKDSDIFSGVLTTFDGQAVSPSDVLIKYTYNGDADLSGTVDDNDGADGDFNYDGKVDDTDVSIMGLVYGNGTPNGIGSPL